MYFFNDTISIYTIAFGSLFNNFKVHRISNDKKVKEISVPLSYAGKTHWYMKKFQNIPDIDNIGKILPMISFTLENITPNRERQTNKFENIQFDVDITRAVKEWVQTSIPYKFGFNINIWTKFQSDMNQIIEQILPFYPSGSRDLHIKEIPILGVHRSTRVELSSVNPDIQVDFDEKGDRIIQYSLSFELDGYMYPPIEESKIINNIDINTYIETIQTNYNIETILNTETE